MGWWKLQGTDETIGDGPLETLGVAVSGVLEEYQRAFGRKPTRLEWEALLHSVLGADEPEHKPVADGIVKRVELSIE